MDLLKNHLTLLCKASHAPVRLRQDKYQDTVNYLLKNKLINFTIEKGNRYTYYIVETTELGKAVLYEKTRSSRRAAVALALSIISIVLSFLVAFTPFADWSKQLISLLF